jgi:exopolysaccharide biosynthesis WecB/TagA/CpsF family protein
VLNTKSVAFFMHDFSGGGVEAMRINLAASLLELGYRVSVIVANSSGPVRSRVPAGILIVDLESHSFAGTLLSLMRHLAKHQPDFLVSSLGHNNVAALCACLSPRIKARLIVCQHNALSQEIGVGWRYWPIPALYWMLQLNADAFVAVSSGVANDLIETAHLQARRVHVISNPVIGLDFAGRSRTDARPPHPWLEQSEIPVFLFVGRLTPQKDPVTLIEAFALCLEARAAKLIILGEGELRSQLEQLVNDRGISDHVHFSGYVTEPARWISLATALVLTSRYEGFGNVIVEALACGTPVIATDCCHGPSEILAEGKYGHLVAVGDPRAVANAMCQDFGSQFPAALLRERGQAFTATRCAESHDALFNRITRIKARKTFKLNFTKLSAINIANIVASQRPSKPLCIVTPNIDHVRLLRHRDVLSACSNAAIVCADGWPVALFVRIRTGDKVNRVTGCDIVNALMMHAEVRTRKISAVVECDRTAVALEAWLAKLGWSNWKIHIAPTDFGKDLAGQRDLLEQLRIDRSDILILTLGAPVSEVFAYRNRSQLPLCWILCVGQALRVHIGATSQAPSSWRQLGFEWAWRLIKEPKRLGIRYLQDITWFPWAIVLDLARTLGR